VTRTVTPSHAAARVEAQAKLNLFLHVLGRGPDGYHQLETLFQRIALADTVVVRTDVAARTLDCRGAATGPTEDNLAWRAAAAFALAAGWPASFAIEIDKRIPVGGGLGGGSADAAAVLRAMNALAPRPLERETLASLAFRLGADVPYLLTKHSLALGTGRGERLVALGPLPAREIILLVPPFGVSSREAFEWHVGRHDGAPRAPHARPLPSSPLGWNVVAGYAANDLEEAVFANHPSLAGLRAALEQSGASIARMTGSGSTVFGVFPPVADGPAGAAAFPPLGAVDATRIDTSTVDRVAELELL